MRSSRWSAAALAAGFILAAGALPSFARSPSVSLRTEKVPGLYHVQGSFEVAAGPATVWAVLSDYEGIGGFVSSIESSKVVRRGPHAALVEQVGVGRFLLASRKVKLTLEVLEEPPARIAFKSVEQAQFVRYDGAWRIMGSTAGCSVSYELHAQPAPGMGPGFAARSALKKNVRSLLGEVRDEIERRTAAKGSP